MKISLNSYLEMLMLPRFFVFPKAASHSSSLPEMANLEKLGKMNKIVTKRLLSNQVLCLLSTNSRLKTGALVPKSS